ncbi:MAG: S8 family serine peptidase, partial [Rhodanobacteraceae bacterium]|nr:S8 family serine peptidase [Rhodanobacteraceae bacterium]
NFSALTPGTQNTRFIVHYRDAVAYGAPDAAKKLAPLLARLDTDMQRVGALLGTEVTLVRTTATGGQLIEVGSNNGSFGVARAVDAATFMAQFASNPEVAYIEPDGLAQIARVPNDEYYSWQWHLNDERVGIRVEKAWDYSTGNGVTVAVLDTGIAAHPDLAGQIISGYDFISNKDTARDGGGREADPNDEGDWWENFECGQNSGEKRNSSWHGTRVAGIIAERTDNGIGHAGIAYNANVVPVRVLGRCGGAYTDVADAIIWAAGGHVESIPDNRNPARVINMSLGGSGSCDPDSVYQRAINAARSRGAVVVVSAGNAGVNASTYTPASCAGVITVAASEKNGSRASYSNYGTAIDVTAPGGDQNLGHWIYTTSNTGTKPQDTWTYKGFTGTSAAAPQVAAIAALILAKNPALTPDEVEKTIKDTARVLPGKCFVDSAGRDLSSYCGAGLVDAGKAVLSTTNPIFENNTRSAIYSDIERTYSAITVNGLAGNAPKYLDVLVDIAHVNTNALEINLIAPDGSRKQLKAAASGSSSRLEATYMVDASAWPASGKWQLEVTNLAQPGAGKINYWGLKLRQF